MFAVILIIALLSIVINVILVWYTREVLTKIYIASEVASEFFTRLDTYRSHLKEIHNLELFYGDKNLKQVIEHTNDLISFLKKYSVIYSFTQPELEEILREEDIQPDAEEKETKEIFH